MMNHCVFTFTIAATLLSGAAHAAPKPSPISPSACLRKIALDLTNHAPSDEDYAALKAGTPLGTFVDKYLATPEFSQVAFDVYRGEFAPSTLVPDDADKAEPARIARRLLVNNIDFRDLVTANYSVDESGNTVEGTNGPAAGVLSTQNYLSAFTGIEYRNWAGHLLKTIAGIELTAISDVPEGVDASREGLATNPACAGCHANPLNGVDYVAAFHDCYDDKGLKIEGCTPKMTEFLGKTGSTLVDLGRILADSPEWRAQTIQSFHWLFWGRGIGRNETSRYRRAEAAWLEDNYRPHALVKHMVLAPEYCSR